MRGGCVVWCAFGGMAALALPNAIVRSFSLWMGCRANSRISTRSSNLYLALFRREAWRKSLDMLDWRGGWLLVLAML